MKTYPKPVFRNYWIGFIVGLISPFFILFCYWLYVYSYMSFIPDFLKYLSVGKILASVISLCVVPNLGIFFVLLNKERYKSAYGIIGATLLYALYIFYLKLFIEA